MNCEEFQICLGRTVDSPEVVRILAALEPKKIRVPRDEDEAYVEWPKKGLALIFRHSDPKRRQLTLVAVKFYSDTEHGYVAFSGELPRKLSFADSRMDAHKKLGKPTEINEAMRLDVWRTEERVLALKYDRATHRVGVITLQPPGELNG